MHMYLLITGKRVQGSMGETEGFMNTRGLKTPERIEYWSKALPLIQDAHRDTGYFQNYWFTDDVGMRGDRIGGFIFSCSANRDRSRVELCLSAPRNANLNHSAFDYLYERKDEIEAAFGDSLHWWREVKHNSSFITHWSLRYRVTNREEWPKLAEYHASMSRRLYEVMTPYLRRWNEENRLGLENFPAISAASINIFDLDTITDEEIKNLTLPHLEMLALRCSSHIPVKGSVTRQEYRRNAIITAYAKRRANGICQLCLKAAPFKTPDGEPYLEVHHIKWLMNGGSDSIENTVALCPNCHRKMHSLNLPEDVRKLKESTFKNKNNDK